MVRHKELAGGRKLNICTACTTVSKLFSDLRWTPPTLVHGCTYLGLPSSADRFDTVALAVMRSVQNMLLYDKLLVSPRGLGARRSFRPPWPAERDLARPSLAQTESTRLN